MKHAFRVMLLAGVTVVVISGCGSYQKIAVEMPTIVAAGERLETLAITETATISEKEVPLSTETAIAMVPVDEIVYVTGSKVNVRASAGMTGAVIGSANRGLELKRTGYQEEWSQVEYQGQVSYIASRYLTTEKPVQEELAPVVDSVAVGELVSLDTSWNYAEFSKINSGSAKLYCSEAAARRNITVCVNAGHGTSGGSKVKTLCHPDGTAKVTGGTTGAGATTAVAVSAGMTFLDGTSEASVTLKMAKILKEVLLANGYDVLMIRESEDVQLDNIARTVIANQKADCHIALHWDSTERDKGAFYMSVPNVESYRGMEPVKSNWQKHQALGECLVAGLREAGVKIFSSGAMEMDLTQTSYSTIPSVDIELGDRASDHSEETLKQLAGGILNGLNQLFE